MQFIAPSNAAVKPGSVCTKLNSTSTSSGFKYTCIKSGSKLVWNKGVKVATPTPTETRRPQKITLSENARTFEKYILNIQLPIQTEEMTGYSIESQSRRICTVYGEIRVSFYEVGTCILKVSVKETTKYLANSELFYINVVAKPTPTPSASPTPTPTATVSVRPSATPTPSPTVLPSIAPIPTPTESVRPSVIPTPSASPTATVKPSATPTSTPTVQASPTPTSTPTVQASPTPTLWAATVSKPLWISYNVEYSWMIASSTLSVGTPLSVSAQDGYDHRINSLSITGANCVLNGHILSALAAATCTVTAKSIYVTVNTNDKNVYPVLSTTKTFNFVQPVDQAPLTLATTSTSTSYLGSIALSTAGGSGNGPVSYNVSGYDCTLGVRRDGVSRVAISNVFNTLKVYKPTTCWVFANKKASAGYKEASSALTQVTFTPIAGESLSILYEVAGGAKADSMAIGEGASLRTNDVSFQATDKFSVSGANCSLGVGNYVRATSATTCIVTATRDAYEINKRYCFNDGYCKEDYWYFGPTTSAPVSFVFDYRDQAPVFIYNPVTTTTAPFVYLISMGGSGTGSTTYSVSGQSCSISGTGSNTMLNATAPATCVVTATKAASPIGYRSAVTSLPKTFYFTKP